MDEDRLFNQLDSMEHFLKELSEKNDPSFNRRVALLNKISEATQKLEQIRNFSFDQHPLPLSKIALELDIVLSILKGGK